MVRSASATSSPEAPGWYSCSTRASRCEARDESAAAGAPPSRDAHSSEASNRAASPRPAPTATEPDGAVAVAAALPLPPLSKSCCKGPSSSNRGPSAASATALVPSAVAVDDDRADKYRVSTCTISALGDAAEAAAPSRPPGDADCALFEAGSSGDDESAARGASAD